MKKILFILSVLPLLLCSAYKNKRVAAQATDGISQDIKADANMLKQLRGQEAEMWLAVSRINGVNKQRVYVWKNNKPRTDTAGVGNHFVIFPDVTINGVVNDGPGAWDSADFGYGIWNIMGLQAALDAKQNASSAFNGTYAALSGKPTIPTNTNQLTNGAGFITGYTETDPTVPAAAKSITSGNITTWNDKSWTSITGKPTFFDGAYSSLTGRPTLFSGAYTDLTGKPVLFDGQYSSLTGLPALFTASQANALYRPITYTPSGAEIATALGYTPSSFTKTQADALYKSIGYLPSTSEITVALGYTPYNGATNPNNYITATGVQTAARTALSALANGGVTYNATTGEIGTVTPTYNNTPARALNTSYRASLTRPTRVSYTLSVISVVSVGQAIGYLEISSDNVNWVQVSSAGETSVGLLNTKYYNIQGEVPAGYYVRIRSAVTLGGQLAFVSGQEVIY